MSNIINVTVKENAKKTKNGNYHTVLTTKGELVETPLGNMETPGKTYYMFLDKLNKKGKKAKLDLDMFDVVLRPYTFEDEETEEEKTIELKYLFPMRDED